MLVRLGLLLLCLVREVTIGQLPRRLVSGIVVNFASRIRLGLSKLPASSQILELFIDGV